ncbi:alanine racemase [uncultured Parasphingorhabdus sp.]|uniref:alanine racemase n=1 Tax=uncultured Parasphingorhabdus sp. TaxID=2709694 RepID=UPI0030DC3BDB|tara:strand:+ start:54882 stop:55937 length:1056 start_codon:yes stop_codon:yes gene_type:complete
MSDDKPIIAPTATIRLDSDALVANWRNLDRLSGQARAGAAVKANAYGLGVRAVVQKLLAAGCTDFFVANWQEAQEIEDLTAGEASVSVLNGVREADMAFAMQSPAKPVINSLEQLARWKTSGKPCDMMINSGMNRLGINVEDLKAGLFDGMAIDVAMSHLASADEDGPQNSEQLAQYQAALEVVPRKRTSLANSAGIALGSQYHFDLTRPGLSLYGGIQRPVLEDIIAQVAVPQAEIIQVRSLQPGDKLGYNAQYVADRSHDVGILAMGYADGYLRGFSNSGLFMHQGQILPVLGRVSMDLIAIDLSNATHLKEGDWVDCEYDLRAASSQSGLSQYELITGLGNRLARQWT